MQEAFLEQTELLNEGWYIEVCDKEGKFVEGFGFSVPPQSVEVERAFRKSEAATFGGTHIDDYGTELKKITMSGATHNARDRTIRIGREEGSVDGVTSKGEIDRIAALFKTYKARKKIVEGYIFLLYDVKNGEAWRFFPSSFSASQDASNPFSTKWTLSGTLADFDECVAQGGALSTEAATGDSYLSGAREKVANWTKDGGFLKQAQDALENVKKNEKLQAISKALNTVQDVTNLCTDVIDQFDATIAVAEGLLTKYVNEVANAAKALKNLPNKLAQRITSLCAKRTATARSICSKMSQFSADVTSVCATGKYWENFAEIFTGYQSKEALAWTGGAEEWAKCWCYEGIWAKQEEAESIYAGGISSSLPEIKSRDGASGGNASISSSAMSSGEVAASVSKSIVQVWGEKTAAKKATDTAESLAEKYMGSADFAADVLEYNGVSSIGEVDDGAALKFPITSKAAAVSGNKIYADSGRRDFYGRDILVDENRLVPLDEATQDFAVSAGKDNLSQALVMRLSESSQKRIRVEGYGIKSSVGGSALMNALVGITIRQTVAREPRVKAIRSLEYEGTADGLNYTLIYDDASGGEGEASGTL